MASFERQLKSVRLIERVWSDDTQSYIFPFCIRNILRTFECKMADVLNLSASSRHVDLWYYLQEGKNATDTCVRLSCT